MTSLFAHSVWLALVLGHASVDLPKKNQICQPTLVATMCIPSAMVNLCPLQNTGQHIHQGWLLWKGISSS